MTLTETITLLKKNDVPPGFYCIDGLGKGECVGIAQEAGRWQTYYSERGSKGSVKSFVDESDACLDFLQRLQRYLTGAGIQKNLVPIRGS